MIPKYLNLMEAQKEFKKSSYISTFSETELKIRYKLLIGDIPTGSISHIRRTIQNAYLTSCIDFSDSEKTMLNNCFNLIYQIISAKTHNNFFIPDQIKLIKLNSRNSKIDWGYLFTINDCIVLPNNYIDNMSKDYKHFLKSISQISLNSVGPRPSHPNLNIIKPHLINLFHETVHVMQRTSSNHMDIFEYIYRKIWNFESISKQQLVNLDPSINFLTNPDGYNFEWIIPLYSHKDKKYHYFLPALIYDYDRMVPQGILIELAKRSDQTFKLTKNWNQLTAFPNYTNKFYGLQSQLYHPNEIIAQLISEYLVNGELYSNTPDSFYFYDYINKFLLSDNNY